MKRTVRIGEAQWKEAERPLVKGFSMILERDGKVETVYTSEQLLGLFENFEREFRAAEGIWEPEDCLVYGFLIRMLHAPSIYSELPLEVSCGL